MILSGRCPSSGAIHAAQLAVEQDAWNAALARARGERILDDPKLLSRCVNLTSLPLLPKQATHILSKGMI